MRGADTFTESLFLMNWLDDFVPADHPLRAIREMVNKALVAMDDAVWVPTVLTKNRQDGDDSDGGNFCHQQRSNETHESKTDGDARLYRKGKTASELRFMGHTLADNRNGLVVNAMVTKADGHAEREAAKAMINDVRQLHEEETTLTLGQTKATTRKSSSKPCSR